jgi:hypothetical protein
VAYLANYLILVTLLLIFWRFRCDESLIINIVILVLFVVFQFHLVGRKFFNLCIYQSLLSLFQLILPLLLVYLKLIMQHLRVLLLLEDLLAVFSLFIFLIPTPFINLRLCKTGCLGNSHACLFCPVWILIILLHEILHLVRIFPVSFLPTIILIRIYHFHHHHFLRGTVLL